MYLKRVRFCAVALLSAVALSACGGSSEQSSGNTNNGAAFAIESDSMGVSRSYNSSKSGSGGSRIESTVYEEGATDSSTPTNYDVDEAVSLEMLVYSGKLSIKTDDFDKSVEAFHNDVTELGGFIEHQNIDNGVSLYDSSTGRKEFTARVRIPSSVFQDLVDAGSKYGKVISVSTNVENIAQEYVSTTASLEVYEVKYKRYLELLSQAHDTSDMIEIERELTNTESTIASYKAQLRAMDTDVAYSTLNVSIAMRVDDMELSDDTFFSRLMGAFKDSFKWFLAFIQNIIIWIVLYWWYAALLVLIIIGVRKLNQRYLKKHPPKQFKVKSEAEKKVLKPGDFEGDIDVTASKDDEGK